MKLYKSLSTFVLGLSLVVHGLVVQDSYAQEAKKKPNILVIWGDDIGGFNVGA